MQELLHSIAVTGVQHCRERGHHQSDEPCAPPNRRQDDETNRGIFRARQTFAVDCSDDESVTAGRQAGIIESALVRGRAPVGVGAFQPVLIPQRPCPAV